MGLGSGARRLAAVVLVAAPAAGQSLERPPNLGGVWTGETGAIHFNVLHRFEVLDPPARKVVNTPTLTLAAGVTDRVLLGGHYATSSRLVAGRPNEWEVFGRWAPLRAVSAGVDGAVRAGWNGTAESLDGEVSLARSVGPVTLHLAGRAFSAWRGGEAAATVAAGAVWRLQRWVALAGDVVRPPESDADPGWSAGIQLGIPYTPHTLSLHVSNVNATTLQSSSMGLPGGRLWGFEFTVPITLSRYFGGAAAAPTESVRVPPAASMAADTVRVAMDNRLRFLPDTVRVPAGGVVAWENTSDIVHTVTADPRLVATPARVALPAGAEPFHSGDMVPGETFSRRFTVPGVYRYVCLPHEAAGMMGVVIVEDV